MPTYRYRADVLAHLERHGVKPTPATPPARARDVVSDLYRYEIRALRDRYLRREFPNSEYLVRVENLRGQYTVLSLPIQFWAVSE